MEIKLLKLFPKAAMHMTMERDFTSEELVFIMDMKNTLLRNVGNDSSIDMDILRFPEMLDLKKFIQKSLDIYFLHVYQPKTPKNARLTLTQSWLNFTKPGEFHHVHSHPNSIISGCLYISAEKGKDMITFENREIPQYQIETDNINEFNSNEISVPVVTRDIVLFPSNMLHKVPRTESSDVRISIAFNSFFRGKIGNVDSDKVNYLEL